MARSKAQPRMWLICSFMVRESGTCLAAMEMRSCSVMSRSARRARVMAETTHCSISAPVQPTVNLVSCRRLNALRATPRRQRWILKISTLLVGHRQIDEKDFVEAAFADHFGGQQIDAVGGGGHEQAARLFLHPGEEEAEDAALLAAGFGGAEPLSISSNHSTAGAMSSIMRQACTNTPSGLPCRPEKISVMSMR